MLLNYQVETDEGVLRIKLAGEMTYESLRDIADGVRRCLEDNPKAVTIDLSGVTYIGEDGMAFLLQMYRTGRNKGIPVYAEGATGRVAERMHRAGFDQFLRPP